MIFWTGWGIIVFPLMAPAYLMGIGAEAAFGPRPITDIALIIGFVVNAVLLRWVGKAMNYDGNEHTCFGAAVQHWAWLNYGFAGAGVFIVLYVAFGGT